jgi:hypothetical protein
LPACHRIDAQDAGVAANVDVTGEGNLLGQGEHEFDRSIGLKRCRAGEVKSTETDVPGFTGLLDVGLGSGVKAYFHRKRHRKSPGGPALWVGFGYLSVCHWTPTLAPTRGQRQGFWAWRGRQPPTCSRRKARADRPLQAGWAHRMGSQRRISPRSGEKHQDDEKLAWGQIAEHPRQREKARAVLQARAVDNPEAGRVSFAR